MLGWWICKPSSAEPRGIQGGWGGWIYRCDLVLERKAESQRFGSGCRCLKLPKTGRSSAALSFEKNNNNKKYPQCFLPCLLISPVCLVRSWPQRQQSSWVSLVTLVGHLATSLLSCSPMSSTAVILPPLGAEIGITLYSHQPKHGKDRGRWWKLSIISRL